MFLILSLLVTLVLADVNDLVGTWTTKSRQVITGPVCRTIQIRIKTDVDRDSTIL
jgi:hypothetical protein